MKMRLLLVPGAAVTALSFLSTAAQAQTLFWSELDSSAGWTVNAQTAGDLATFGFDYSARGIPASPNGGGTTIGLMLQANRPGNGVQSAVSVSPTGLSLSGDYELRYDLWHNFNGALTPPGFPGGGTGSTQITGGGLFTAGISAQRSITTGGNHDGLGFYATGDGGATQDYRIYTNAGMAAPATGYYEAGTTTSPEVRNSNHPYYASFGSVSAPAAQTASFPQQNGTTQVGSQGFEWHDVVITKAGNIVTWRIDGIIIGEVDTTGLVFGGSNFHLTHADINATTTDASGEPLLFGLIDNVRVNVVPEPTSAALMAMAGAFMLARRRRN